MCFSMFCAIPTPFMHVWDESVRGIMLTMFPMVGAFIGVIWSLVGILLDKINCPQMLSAAVMAITPFILTGGIHLDGYMDCCDGIFSRRDLERRREILKDSHVGSFAVVGLAILFMVSFAAFASFELENTYYWNLIFIAVMSRCCSALGITSLRPMGHSEYAGDFQKSISKTNVAILIVFAVVDAVLSFYFFGIKGIVSVFTAATGYWISVWYAFRQFDGFSGDVTGFGHTISELCGVLALVLMR